MPVQSQDRRHEPTCGDLVEARCCAACGERIYRNVNTTVDRIREAIGVHFCPTCDERACPPDEDDELGIGD